MCLVDVLKVFIDYKLLCYEILQLEYNLYDCVGYEKELELLVQCEQIGVIGYYVLVSGFFSGKYCMLVDVVKSLVCGEIVVKCYLNLCGLCILQVLDDVVSKYSVSVVQIVLVWQIVWLLVIVLIVSVISIEQLYDLLVVVSVLLSVQDVVQLDVVSVEV